jgi:hypothetical protein
MKGYIMKRHFVTFYSPGTFVSEVTEVEVPEWDIDFAREYARHYVKERHGATPYGFNFKTMVLEEGDWLPRTVATSGMYFLGGKILSLDDIPDIRENEVLRWNMRTNGWDYVIENTNSWKIVLPYEKNDTLLEFDVYIEQNKEIAG